MSDKKYRLVTRADFDGIVCGALLMDRGLVDEVLFAEPKDMQDGKVLVTANDIIANLPYVEGAHLCFDHHHSEALRLAEASNLIIEAGTASTARIIYEHYGGKETFTDIPAELMDAVDKADSADFTEEDIFVPGPWTLLHFILDPRTGLSRFCQFDTTHDAFMREMMVYCRRHSIDEILQIPDMIERVKVYEYNEEFFELQIKRCASVHDKLVVVDLRNEKAIYPGNRFTVYAAFPDCNISIQILPHADDDSKTVLAVGKSILKRDSRTDVGALMLEFGGGGHEAAGSCRVPNEAVDTTLVQLIARINDDG